MSDILKMLEGFDAGKVLALFNRLGGRANVDALLAGDLTIEFKDAIAKLIDQYGRCIPPKGMKGVVDANRDFRIIPPFEINCTAVLSRFKQFFPEGTLWPTEAEFARETDALLAAVTTNQKTKNLLKGVYLPIVLPQIQDGDYGTILETVFLPAVERAYTGAFPDRKFVNHCKDDLAKKVTVVDQRHVQLIGRMKKGWVIGLYFSNPLQGFGIQAARQMIKKFPRGFSLSGGFDAATATIADPKTLCRDFHTPTMDCTAIQWQTSDNSLCFFPLDRSLDFQRRYLEGVECYSAGLLFVG